MTIQERNFGAPSKRMRGSRHRRGVQVTVYMMMDDLIKLRERARKNNRSVSNQIRLDITKGNK